MSGLPKIDKKWNDVYYTSYMPERKGDKGKKELLELSPFFGANVRSGAIRRVTPLLDAAGKLLKESEATGETALADEAQRLLEKYVELAGASLM